MSGRDDMGAKGGAGRPRLRYDPDVAEKVRDMSRYGTPQEEIAGLVGISLVPLRRLYKKELELGRCLAKLSVRKKLYERCMAGDTACLIFYAKTQLGWREKDRGREGAADEAVKSLAEAVREAMRSVG